MTELSVDMNQIHYRDIINFHQQVVNMIHMDLDLQHTTTKKLQDSLTKITTQYRLEKVVTQARNVKLKVLEKGTHRNI